MHRRLPPLAAARTARCRRNQPTPGRSGKSRQLTRRRPRVVRPSPLPEGPHRLLRAAVGMGTTHEPGRGCAGDAFADRSEERHLAARARSLLRIRLASTLAVRRSAGASRARVGDGERLWRQSEGKDRMGCSIRGGRVGLHAKRDPTLQGRRGAARALRAERSDSRRRMRRRNPVLPCPRDGLPALRGDRHLAGRHRSHRAPERRATSFLPGRWRCIPAPRALRCHRLERIAVLPAGADPVAAAISRRPAAERRLHRLDLHQISPRSGHPPRREASFRGTARSVDDGR